MDKPIKVLVVDDEPGMRLTLKGILGRKGYGVVLAESGDAALELIKKEKFRLVIMDIKMPGKSGVDTFIEIKKIDPDATVIMMTGFAVENEIRRAIREGAYSILYKPLDMKRLLELVAEGLQNRSLVMVVDSRLEDQTRIQKAFTEKGYSVVQVEDVDTCLTHLRTKKFQVIIFDSKTPGVQDLETLKKVKEIRPDVSVILISSQNEEDWVKEAMRDCSFAMVRKPLDIEKLLEVVGGCIGKNAA